MASISRRFGSDKAEALLDGQRLIDHAGTCLARRCDDVIVVGRADPAWLSVADSPGPGLGPLGGLCGALVHAGLNGFDAVLTLACDMPDVPDEIMAELAASAPAIVASAPVAGCWPAALAGRLETWLNDGKPRAVNAWADAVGARRLVTPPLRNINTPDALD